MNVVMKGEEREPEMVLSMVQRGKNDVIVRCKPPVGPEFDLMLFCTLQGKLKAYSAGRSLLHPEFFHHDPQRNILLVS